MVFLICGKITKHVPNLYFTALGTNKTFQHKDSMLEGHVCIHYPISHISNLFFNHETTV